MVNLEASTTLSEIVIGFDKLDSDTIDYRMEVSQAGSRIDTKELAASECDSGTGKCSHTTVDLTFSPPDYQVCLFVLYPNSGDSPHDCKTVTVPSPAGNPHSVLL